jgi:hypothetical protein
MNKVELTDKGARDIMSMKVYEVVVLRERGGNGETETSSVREAIQWLK